MIEHAVSLVESHDDYRVLRRIKPDLINLVPTDSESYRGVFVDCETTGFDFKKDEIIELALVPFTYHDGGIASIGTALHFYNEPRQPIPEMITGITGITDNMVRGHKIDWQQVKILVADAAMIVAHNAQFDRQMLEASAASIFVETDWACSMTQVPWGDGSKSLSGIANALGWFFDAHTAVADCIAALHCLSLPLANGRTGISYLKEEVVKESRHIWAINAPYDNKDKLKSRGYYWNSGEDGRPKAWHKIIDAADMLAEKEFLAEQVYYHGNTSAVRVTRVTSRNRFTDR